MAPPLTAGRGLRSPCGSPPSIRPGGSRIDRLSLYFSPPSLSVRATDNLFVNVNLSPRMRGRYSFQPPEHVLDRSKVWSTLLSGGRVGFRGLPPHGHTIIEDMAALRPTFVLATPRLFNSLFREYNRELEDLGEPMVSLPVSPLSLCACVCPSLLSLCAFLSLSIYTECVYIILCPLATSRRQHKERRRR